MSKFGRAIKGAQAGACAAAAVALSFFVLDLVRLQPLATPGFLSGAVFGPAGLEWDLTSWSGFVAGLVTAYKITTFTLLHFLTFALVGVFASLALDWKNKTAFKPRRAGRAGPTRQRRALLIEPQLLSRMSRSRMPTVPSDGTPRP